MAFLISGDLTKMTKILVGNKAIRTAVQEIMVSNAKRKIAIVAFVGEGADRYLLGRGTKATGLRVICWDKEGCTSPETVRKFQDNKVQVDFVSDLHMKLYWGSGQGAVIGSANLSDNGLGDGGLHELAIRVPDGVVDIEAILNGLECRPVTRSLLRNLFDRTADFRRRNKGRDVFNKKGRTGKTKGSGFSFDAWLGSRLPEWRLFVYKYNENFKKYPKVLVERPSLDFENCHDYWSGTKWYTQVSKWILFVGIGEKRKFKVTWGMADNQVRMKNTDEYYLAPYETYYAVQMNKNSKHPPFTLDPKFKEAIKKFINDNKISDYSKGAKFTEGNTGGLSHRQLKELNELYNGAKPSMTQAC